MVRLTYVVPVHDEESTIGETVAAIRAQSELLPFDGVEVILVENGSHDGSAAAVQAIVDAASRCVVRGFCGEPAGLGYAYVRGLEEFLSKSADDDWVVLTAGDLPFGFSDLESFRAASCDGTQGDFFIGSKAHPRSRVRRGLARWLASQLFYLFRRILFGSRVGDSQGVLFLRGDLVRQLLPLLQSRDFFLSAEITLLAEWLGRAPVEIPVTYVGERRPSSVRFFKHSCAMVKQLVALRRRLRRGKHAQGTSLVTS